MNLTIDDKKSIQLLSHILLNDSGERLIIVDTAGNIVDLSCSYANFLGVKREDAIGTHVTKIISNTRMHIVAKTGIPEIESMQDINGRKMVANRIPIMDGNRLVGAYGRVVFADTQELVSLYKKVAKITEELNYYKDKFNSSNKAKYSIDDIIGKSNQIKRSKELIQAIGKGRSNVLIYGESGTGKELYAHTIHMESPRRDSPFVSLNCAAIPHELLESELFGYVGGSFTGANKNGKLGLMHVANGGTLFLDEVSEMSLPMQAKMLRVIQEKELRRIGSSELDKIDVRIIAATNKNLSEMIEKEQFREDLYYRLNVVQLTIPPLRERPDDIPLLVDHFIKKSNMPTRTPINGITKKAMEYLMNYSWPGNIRELENIIEGAGNFVCGDGLIHSRHLPGHMSRYNEDLDKLSLQEQIYKIERKIILNMLITTNGNRSQSAKNLGISRTSLYEKMAKHNIVFDSEMYQNTQI